MRASPSAGMAKIRRSADLSCTCVVGGRGLLMGMSAPSVLPARKSIPAQDSQAPVKCLVLDSVAPCGHDRLPRLLE